MASGNAGKGAGSLKRRHPEIGETEYAEGNPSCSSSLGGGEDVSEESISKLQKEVIELAEKVVEYREKGPIAFALLLDKSLARMRSSLSSVDAHVKKMAKLSGIEEKEVDKEVLAQRANLIERVAAANASLPTILLQLKSCKDRLDKAITARAQSPSKNLAQHPPPVL